ncbi:MAG: hypothetical protein IPP47_00385 [Bryobacterales bacterium]|nr:hypothetical protein [Bryobacterales bacterium]
MPSITWFFTREGRAKARRRRGDEERGPQPPRAQQHQRKHVEEGEERGVLDGERVARQDAERRQQAGLWLFAPDLQRVEERERDGGQGDVHVCGRAGLSGDGAEEEE